MRSVRTALFLLLAFGTGLRAVAAPPQEEQARTVVHILEYVGVDYPAFVKHGQVLDSSEYTEQTEFAQQVVLLLKNLPAVQGAPDLQAHALKLQEQIKAKAEGTVITALANALRLDVITAYHLAIAPKAAPDLRGAAALYSAHCASCHGATGHGDGPQAASLDPVPRNFRDAATMDLRSTSGLYNTITLGVEGTSMMPFTGLTEAERWALAFHVAGLRASKPELEQGRALWEKGMGPDKYTSLAALVTATPAAVKKVGGADGAAVLAWLTAHPEALAKSAPSPLALTRSRLADALTAYRANDPTEARRLSISAYLEGFELIESALDNVDAPLRKQTEREMMALRATISAHAPADSVAAGIGRINTLLDLADAELSNGSLSPTTAFLSSLLILVREGLEAILVLAAIIALVLKTGRRDAMPYIHAGWIGALLLGAVTWLVARYLLGISGASREMTEGVTALLAAAMLLYVGYWLHNKSNAKAWQHFIRGKVDAALGKRTLWALAGISFLAVYRELFEIILFYETLFGQSGPEGQHAVLWGIVAGALVLAVVGGAILKFSARLPIGPFFAFTSALLALMAVVFAGNGIAALQEAGAVGATLVHFISVPLLGIHPTAQGLAVQAVVLALVIAGMLAARRHARKVTDK